MASGGEDAVFGLNGGEQDGRADDQFSEEDAAAGHDGGVVDDDREPEVMKEETNVRVTCTVCGEEHDSADALEFHICLDHLRWFRYQCGICKANEVDTFNPTEKGMKMHFNAVHAESNFDVIYMANEKNENDLKAYMDGSIYGVQGTGLLHIKMESAEAPGTVSEFDITQEDSRSQSLGGILKSEDIDD